MSKFAYKAEGDLNSKYLLELLKEYLSQLLNTNSTKGIVEDEYNINPNANRFSQWFDNKISILKYSSKSALLENYNKVLSTKYINKINDTIDIFLQTNVLEAKQFFELKQTFQAIKFNDIIPLIDENRQIAINKSNKKFLKVLNYIKYLKNADTNYILYNSPVDELKPFLSDKVSKHKVDYIEIQRLVKQFINKRYEELTMVDFEPINITFIAKPEDFYNDNITDNGIGEEVEQFIRSKMIEKLDIAKQDEILIEEQNQKIMQIDNLLKRLKINKIESLMQQLIVLKTNLAHVKEVIDVCKNTINSTTLPNKAQMFLVMDNLYYKLQNKCENLQQKTKFKLQMVDKQKMFNLLELIQNPPIKISKSKKKANTIEESENFDIPERKEGIHTYKSHSITSNLYDDEPASIDISEDDGTVAPEDEFVIDDNENDGE